MFSLTTPVQIPASVYFQQLDDEAVLLETSSGKYFGLNPVGARTWELLSQGQSLETVYQTLLDEYAVEPAVLQADLLKLCETLLEKGLLEAAAAA